MLFHHFVHLPLKIFVHSFGDMVLVIPIVAEVTFTDIVDVVVNFSFVIIFWNRSVINCGPITVPKNAWSKSQSFINDISFVSFSFIESCPCPACPFHNPGNDLAQFPFTCTSLNLCLPFKLVLWRIYIYLPKLSCTFYHSIAQFAISCQPWMISFGVTVSKV